MRRNVVRGVLFAVPCLIGAMGLASSAAAQDSANPLLVVGYVVDGVTGEPLQVRLEVRAMGVAATTTRSNAEGRYEVRAPRGSEIRADTQGYLPQTRPATMFDRGSQVELNFLLMPDAGPMSSSRPSCGVEGTVLNELAGGRVGRAQVWLEAPQSDPRGVLSRDDGTFRLTDVPAGLRTLHFGRADFYAEARQVRVQCTGSEAVSAGNVLLRKRPLALYPGTAGEGQPPNS